MKCSPHTQCASPSHFGFIELNEEHCVHHLVPLSLETICCKRESFQMVSKHIRGLNDPKC
jgi:hypothetical protein